MRVFHLPRCAVRLSSAGLCAILCAACAAPLQRSTTAPPTVVETRSKPAIAGAAGRSTVGVALGGGSARGIAHVGVIRWFEEHRIPIDVAAGTSMGGLVGGAFATGMDAAELKTFIGGLNWDELFGSSNFAFKNIRRKADARDYPTRLEFGVKKGIVPQTALNNGNQVELLLGRLTGPYFELTTFDDLPTPFRTVAVDLLSAREVVLSGGSLADAMRATMSLPLIFPPMEIGGQVLIDGGTMNNIPANVVKDMGADRVVAVNVGDLSDREGVTYTMLGLAGSTIDAMMRASTKRAVAAADILINVPLKDYGSLDWRRAGDLMEEGYKAAEAMRDQLLPLAVSEAQYEEWKRGRRERRKTEMPAPAFVAIDGFGRIDAKRLDKLLSRHVGVPLDLDALETDIAVVSGLDRYETITWKLVHDSARGYGITIHGRPKAYAPPFLMLGMNLENTTSSDFRVTVTGRYLTFDTIGSGSEIRIDGTLGSDPHAAIELYRPLGGSPLFIAPYAAIGRTTIDFVQDDEVIATYGQRRSRVGANAGVNLGAQSDLRVGFYVGRTSASIEVGDPLLPEASGKDVGAEVLWRMDTQDSPVVPSTGLLSQVRLARLFDGPDVTIEGQTFELQTKLTQLSGSANYFWSRGPDNRLFLAGGFGTSFDSNPIGTLQFTVGGPFRLGGYSPGEIRGSHAYVITAGYLRRVTRLPDFIGGPVFAGGWLDNGDAFDDWSDATWRTNGGVGVIMDTLVGPVILAGSWGFDGRWRTYLGIGRIFK